MAQQHLEALTKRLLCTPVESTYAYKTRGEEQWHCGPAGASVQKPAVLPNKKT